MNREKEREFPQLWPRLLDVCLSARYLSVGEQTIRDWYADGILVPVELPGSCLRKGKTIVARPSQRKIGKLLFDLEDLNRLIDRAKGGA